jgi:signal transduction histidine kinase
LALAATARTATFYGERARELQQRIDLARDLHERVVQRLFGVAMALSPAGDLNDSARERCAEELRVALSDLRAALSQPLGTVPRPTRTTFAAELKRLTERSLDFDLQLEVAVVDLPTRLQPLAQSVLAEAVRNALKHARARTLTVRTRREDGLLILEIENDGLDPRRRGGPPGLGLRIAALEAIQSGGLLEFGERRRGRWQVRLAVPEDAP